MAEIAERWTMTAVDAPPMASRFDPFPPGVGDVVAEVAGSGARRTDLADSCDGVCSNCALPSALDREVSGHVAVAPFVERHPQSEINHVFEAVRAGSSKRRAVLVS